MLLERARLLWDRPSSGQVTISRRDNLVDVSALFNKNGRDEFLTKFNLIDHHVQEIIAFRKVLEMSALIL